MKKFVVLSMLGVLLITGNLSATEFRVASPSPDIVINIGLRIVFHRPKFDCERGLGICFLWSGSIQLENSVIAKDYCKGTGHINEKNQLVISVTEEELTRYEGGGTLIHFKDKPSLTLQDPYPIPDETCRALGVKPPQVIQPGTYPISYQDGTYTVVIQL